MFSWLRNRRNKKRIQNRTKEQELIQRIGDIILYELPIEEQDNWLKSVVEQGLYIPTHVDGDLNEKLKEMIVEKTLEKPESVSSDAMGKLQKGADVAKAQENPVDLTRERWQKEKETREWEAQFRVPPVYTGNWTDEDYENWRKRKEPIKPFEEWREEKRREGQDA